MEVSEGCDGGCEGQDRRRGGGLPHVVPDHLLEEILQSAQVVERF